jgi:hypothetical protein
MDRHQDATFMPIRLVRPTRAAEAPPEVVAFDLAAAISERDVWRLATLMVEGYGVAALYRAAMIADEMALRGDDERRVAWKRIFWAIGELARDRPRGALN